MFVVPFLCDKFLYHNSAKRLQCSRRSRPTGVTEDTEKLEELQPQWMNENQGPHNHAPGPSLVEIALFVINAQLNLTWSPQIPCKVTD